MVLSEQRSTCGYGKHSDEAPGVCVTETYLRVHRDCAAFASIIKRPYQKGGLSVKGRSVAINNALVQPSQGRMTMFPPRYEVELRRLSNITT